MDKRIFSAGIAMLVFGIASSMYLNSTYPVANRGGLTDDETRELLRAQADNQALSSLFHIVAGLGFFLLLISMGLKRKKSGAGKTVTQKPAQT